MSRIGKLPIPLVGVKVTLADGAVTIQGPKGVLTHALPAGITAETAGDRLVLKRADDAKRSRALHGLARAAPEAEADVAGVVEPREVAGHRRAGQHDRERDAVSAPH